MLCLPLHHLSVTFLHKLSKKIFDVNTMQDPWTSVTPAFMLQPYTVTVRPIRQPGQIYLLCLCRIHFDISSGLCPVLAPCSRSIESMRALCRVNISVSRRISLTLTNMSPFIAFEAKWSLINIFCLHIMVIQPALYYGRVKYHTLIGSHSLVSTLSTVPAPE